MKTKYLSLILLTVSLISFPSFSQTDEDDEPLLGLPGDNLDLYAVLDLFQNSKTIEDFEKSLNEEATGINNIDLDNDGKTDFIKVVTEKDGDDFLFILQDPVSETETQDIAIISVSKDAAGKVSMQIIGDEALYGKDYVVEPISKPTEGITANPAYQGEDPVIVNVPATTEVIVVEATPIVQHVYSPVFVPYVSPFFWGFHPVWWRPTVVVGIGIYRRNHWHRHRGFHGGRGRTNVNININNRNTINNYNRNRRNTSNRVNNNISRGNYNTAGRGGSRPSASQGGRGSGANASNRSSTRPTTSQANRGSGTNASNRSSTRSSSASSGRTKSGYPSSTRSSSSRPSSSQSSRSSASNRSSSASRSSASRSSSPSRSSSSSRSRSSGGGRRR